MRDQLKHVHLQHHSLREQQTHAVIRQEGIDVDGVNESKSAVTNADSKSKAKSWKETQAHKKKRTEEDLINIMLSKIGFTLIKSASSQLSCLCIWS